MIDIKEAARELLDALEYCEAIDFVRAPRHEQAAAYTRLDTAKAKLRSLL